MESAHKVLVVDDNRINRELAKAFLQKDGWSVSEADNGEDALQRLTEDHYNAILLDISMPGRSGIEILESIRKLAANPNIYAVAYTAHALDDEKRRIMASGFDNLLIKPISKAAMTAVFEPLKKGP